MRRMHVFLLAAVLLVLASCSAAGGSPTPTTAPAVPTSAALPAAAETSPASTASPVAVTAAPAASPAGPTEIPTPGPGQFENPVIRSNFPDPFVLHVDGTFYAYATNGPGGHVQMTTSSDLVTWKRPVDAMPSLAPWVNLNRSDVWAPEVIQIGDTFNLYYTARDKASGKQCVGVATGSKPEGKFKDTRTAPIVCQTDQGGSIDPDPFRDGDKLYLLFKNDGNCCGFPTYIYIQQMSPDGLSVVGQPVQLERNDAPWEGRVVEAPTMYVHDGKYYLFYSANDYAGIPYAVGYASCKTVTGPCTDASENPILKSEMTQKPFVVGPGHQSIVDVNGKTWIIYHAWNVTGSGLRGDVRQVYIDRLIWKDGKPEVEGPTTGPQPKP